MNPYKYKFLLTVGCHDNQGVPSELVACDKVGNGSHVIFMHKK